MKIIDRIMNLIIDFQKFDKLLFVPSMSIYYQ